MLSLTVLGSGTSHGVPMIGCSCAVCTSPDPRDKRTRPSIVVHCGARNVLIDTAPELRLQLVATGIGHIHTVLYTHSHADHMHGIDDLRRFNEQLRGPLPVHAAPEVLEDIRHRFAYIFGHHFTGGGIPALDLRPINGPFEVFGQPVIPVPILHGTTPVLGYRFGNAAYITDTNHIPESSQALLQDLDVLIIDALRVEPHPTHFNFEQAEQIVRLLRPRRTYFTHLTHGTMHAEVEPLLPEGIALAYDGLHLEID